MQVEKQKQQEVDGKKLLRVSTDLQRKEKRGKLSTSPRRKEGGETHDPKERS